MKISNFGMINLMNTLDAFGDRKLPQKISYAITRTLMDISKEYSYYDKELKKLFKSYDGYIQKDDGGNMIMNDSGIPIVEGDKSQEFIAELNELLNIEVEISIKYINCDVFDYDDTDKYDVLSPIEIATLQSILCNEGGENNKNEVSN